MDFLEEEIILTFLYPRLDIRVSMEINHLLKAPFCVHPKTGKKEKIIYFFFLLGVLGKVCVPFKTEQLETFSPFNVPLLANLVKEPSNVSNSLTPYIK